MPPSASDGGIDLVFLLAPPRSFTTVVSSMLGQHPQLYGLPEMHLFTAETLGEWWRTCSQATYDMDHGPIRVVAELIFGIQNARTVQAARGWIRRRAHLTTGEFLEILAEYVRPRVMVDKSPSIVYQFQGMRRLDEMFPRTRYIHLTRHPRGHGESVMKYLEERKAMGPVPAEHWLLHLANFPTTELAEACGDRVVAARFPDGMDPQRSWFALNAQVARFLESIPSHRKLVVRGEEVVGNPDAQLPKICRWLGIRDDAAAIEEMKHPERSPYACYGPRGAPYGNDRSFLRSPELRPPRHQQWALDGPLAWRSDSAEFAPAVLELARGFGYC